MKKIVFITAIGIVLAAIPAASDSLFSEHTERRGTLVADGGSKFEVGDIITVMVRENINASSRAETNTRKEAEVSSDAAAGNNQFLVADRPEGYGITNPERLPNWDIDVRNEHRARGQTQRTNDLVMTLACTVTRVYDNGNLEIMGNKIVRVNREDHRMSVTGTIRSRDVTPGNSIESAQVANANIQLTGRGPLWNNQRRGIFTRFLDWISPF